jgi:hypothetical protein
MIATAESPSKVCYACGQELPIDQFRHRRRGRSGRQGRCRACYNAYMRGYRAARRSRTLCQFTSLLRRRTSLNRLAGLCNANVGRFGGLDGLAVAWKEHIDAAPPGSRTALSAFSAIARLLEAVDAHRLAPDYAALSDEDLQREIQRLHEGLLLQQSNVIA